MFTYCLYRLATQSTVIVCYVSDSGHNILADWCTYLLSHHGPLVINLSVHLPHLKWLRNALEITLFHSLCDFGGKGETHCLCRPVRRKLLWCWTFFYMFTVIISQISALNGNYTVGAKCWWFPCALNICLAQHWFIRLKSHRGVAHVVREAWAGCHIAFYSHTRGRCDLILLLNIKFNVLLNHNSCCDFIHSKKKKHWWFVYFRGWTNFSSCFKSLKVFLKNLITIRL